MSSANINALALAWRAAPTARAAAALWRALKPAVNNLVFRRRGLAEPDELRGDAGLGFVLALRSWEPDRGYSFASWAVLQIRSQMNSRIQVERTQWQRFTAVDAAADAPISAWDVAVARLHHQQLSHALADARRDLKKTPLLALESRLAGHDVATVASRHGLTRQALYAAEHRAIDYLRDRMAEGRT